MLEKSRISKFFKNFSIFDQIFGLKYFNFLKKLAIMRATFIEMSLRALGNSKQFLREEKFTADDTIMIFDIDYCLYQNSEMHKVEKDFVTRRLKTLRIDYNSKSWKSYVVSLGSSKHALYRQFGFLHEKISREYDFQSVEDFLSPQPDLKKLLKSIKCKKFCFTNGYKIKAEKILKRLDILDCFIAVFCADSKDYEFILKPSDKAYEFVEQFLDISGTNKPKIIFFDDSKSNCTEALKFNWTPIHVQESMPIEDCLRKYILNPEAFEKENHFHPSANPEKILRKDINHHYFTHRPNHIGNNLKIPKIDA